MTIVISIEFDQTLGKWIFAPDWQINIALTQLIYWSRYLLKVFEVDPLLLEGNVGDKVIEIEVKLPE